MLRDIINKLTKDPISAYENKIYKRKELIETYRALLKTYFEILETVLYEIKDVDEFVKPVRWLSIFFVDIVNDLKQLQEALSNDLPPFIFDDFPNLEINVERIINEYPQKRQRILQYRELVENLFLSVCKFEGALPQIVGNDIKEYNELIIEHGRKRKNKAKKIQDNENQPLGLKADSFPKYLRQNGKNKLQYDYGNKRFILFGKARGNIRLKIFQIIISSEDGTSIDNIAKRVGKNKHDVYTIIRQLNSEKLHPLGLSILLDKNFARLVIQPQNLA